MNSQTQEGVYVKQCMNPLTRLPKIPSDQITPLVAELLGTIQLQMEETQLLKDETARLKSQKPRAIINVIYQCIMIYGGRRSLLIFMEDWGTGGFFFAMT